MTECDPCIHCKHYSESYDNQTGYNDCGCDAEMEFAVCEIKPCPYFMPNLASDGLYEQLYYEEEQEYWEEMERERRQEIYLRKHGSNIFIQRCVRDDIYWSYIRNDELAEKRLERICDDDRYC